MVDGINLETKLLHNVDLLSAMRWVAGKKDLFNNQQFKTVAAIVSMTTIVSVQGKYKPNFEPKVI